MTVKIRNAYAQELYILAAGDESTLQYPLPDNIFGFHAQQACEKYLKVLLTALAVRYPKTHSLDELTKMLADAGEAIPSIGIDLSELEPFAVQFRYTQGVPINDSFREQMRASVKTLGAYILERVSSLEAG